MKSTLRKIGLAGLLMVLAVSLYATNSPPPITQADTNFIDPQIINGNPQVKQLMETMKRDGMNGGSLLDEHFLFASLFWGSVGGGYLFYARKQRMIVPFLGGVAMIGVSCFVSSWVWMSVVCVALIAVMYQLIKREY